ncbi:hypothetical protein GIB67_021695 [Kingdonia uniflora]|uniref:Uncharacterized protein n=1 Tax=Kingdonia uniflora TaxID=39325 RepID=A0A7J7LLZ0_9MAGN|nr:hypothetical protein GIB67_021695 [Kingdonia uniflora]
MHGCACISATKSFLQRQDGMHREVRYLHAQTRGLNVHFSITSIICCLRRFALSKPLCSNDGVFRRRPPATLEYEYESISEGSDSVGTALLKQFHAFYKFSRPHTIIGTVVGIISVSLLPVETLTDLSPTFLVGLLKALIPALLMNVYVVGLNQLYDVEIDKVNKPDLPIASGEFSMITGAAIVTSFSSMSFVMGLMFQSPPLLCALIISFLLGSVYSIDDIPDVDGDRYYGIESFSVRLGQKRVFWLCINLLLVAYVTAVLVGASSAFPFSKLVTILGHCTFASILWIRAQSIDLTSKASVTSFYMFIWKVSES